MDVNETDKWITESKRETDIKIVPWGRRVFGVLDEFATTTGGIVLAEKHSEQCRTGVVYAVGPDCEFFKVGDRFMIKFMDGVQIHLPAYGVTSERFRMFHEDDFLCLVHDDDGRSAEQILNDRLEEKIEEKLED